MLENDILSFDNVIDVEKRYIKYILTAERNAELSKVFKKIFSSGVNKFFLDKKTYAKILKFFPENAQACIRNRFKYKGVVFLCSN